MNIKYLTLLLTLTQLTFTWDWPWSSNKQVAQQANSQPISPNSQLTQQSVWSKISDYIAKTWPWSKQNNLKQCVIRGCQLYVTILEKLNKEPQNSLKYRNASLDLHRCIKSCEAKTQ
jgi:hypothetical protein